MTTSMLRNLLVQNKNVIIGLSGCPDTEKAMHLMAMKNLSFLFIPKEGHDVVIHELRTEYDCTSLPAIFLNEDYIGGFDDLAKKLE